MRVHAQYCTRKCKLAAFEIRMRRKTPYAPHQVRHAEARPIRQPRSLTCPWCGFDNSASTSKYCNSACKNRARYEREKEKRKEYARRAYWQDPVSSRSYSRDYRHHNREVRASQAKRRWSRTDRVPVTAKEWRSIKNRHDNRCAYCNAKTKLTMDHVVPLSRGGRHAPANILPACMPCNLSKRAMFLSEWRLKRRVEVTTPLCPR